MSSINELIVALAKSLVQEQHQAFQTTYVTDTTNEQITVQIDSTTLPLSAVVPPRSLYMDQINVEYVTTADTEPFTMSQEAVSSMKVSIQYKSNPILELH
jgi:TPP-dependent 2-oxoacid decarboxylase